MPTIDLSNPTLEDILSIEIDVQEPMTKTFIKSVDTFIPKLEIQGINLDTPILSNGKVDLEHPPIDLPPVDTLEPEIELNKKIGLPPLDSVLSTNDPDAEIKFPQILNIPDSSIQGEIKLPKKILDELENTYEPN